MIRKKTNLVIIACDLKIEIEIKIDYTKEFVRRTYITYSPKLPKWPSPIRWYTTSSVLRMIQKLELSIEIRI